MRQASKLTVFGVLCVALAAVCGAAELKSLKEDRPSITQKDPVDLDRYKEAPEKSPSETPDYHLERVDDEEDITEAVPDFVPAFAHFNAYDGGDSLINAYLCAYLSQEIYAPGIGYSENWVNAFRMGLIDEGAIEVEFENDATYGAELAAVWLQDAVIIVVRGSHYAGSEAFPLTDWIVDADDDAIQKEFDGFKCRVHEGVWNATSSVYNFIRTTAQMAIAQDKQVWLTGHSLGGATATIAAIRLHYADDIPVAGLQTFGSFKVGDEDFQKIMMQIPGADGVALGLFTQRWEVDGDFATTIPYRDWVWKKNSPGGFYVYYEHVGRTHRFRRSGGFSYPDWTLDFDTDAEAELIALPDSVLPLGEHGDYYPALRNEIEKEMAGTADDDVLQDLLRL